MEGALAPPGEARPAGIGGILDAAWTLYRTRALTLWTIAAVVLVPVQVISRLLLAASLPGDVFAHNGTLYTRSSQTTVNAPLLILTIVILIVAEPLVIGALCRSLVDSYIGHPTDWRTSLRFAGERLWPLLWLAILTAVLVAIASILIFPGIYLAVVWSVAVPVLMFEGLGGFAALRRSQELVRGRWWATFGALLVGIVTAVLLVIVLSDVVSSIASGVHDDSVALTEILSGIANGVAEILTYPLLAAISAVIYIDLRRRKEGFQVRQLAHNPAGELAPTWPVGDEPG